MSKIIDATNLGYLISKIKAAFVSKTDVTAVRSVEIDLVPTSNSTNLVESGGVKTYVDSKVPPIASSSDEGKVLGVIDSHGTLGWVPAGSANAVIYGQQSLTDEQKAQARANVGAASQSDINSIESEVQAIGQGEYIIAWDGVSSPVVADIPAGVSVEYNAVTYIGQLAASDSTLQKIYLVGTGTTDEYYRYVTSRSGSVGSYAYAWIPMGTTAVQLSNYATASQVSRMEDKLDGMHAVEVDEDGVFFVDEEYNVIAEITPDGVRGFGNDNPLFGKKITFIGDSITRGFPDPATTGYVAYFQDYTGCTCVNLGVDGTHLAKKDPSDSSAFINRVANVPVDTDMVVIMGGTNDFGHPATATPFGNFLDGANPNSYTFCAGVHNFFNLLYNTFTVNNIPVVIILPVHYGNTRGSLEYDVTPSGGLTEMYNETTGKSFKEYVQMIKEIAQYYSFETVDAYGESGINACVDRAFSGDGLHLNSAGARKLAAYLVPKLQQIIKEFR